MDIVDRLITRVELQGGAGYVRGLASMGQETARLAASQQKFIDLGARSVMAPGDKDLARQAKAAKREYEGLEKQIARTSLAMNTSEKFFIGGLALTAAVALGSEMIKSQLETEKLSRRMRALFVGPSGPAQGFALASRTANRYHRDLDDVTTAELLLAERGVGNVGAALKDTAVLAQRSGKDMSEVAGDVAKAWLGNRDALREYGLSFRQLRMQQAGGMGGLTGSINDMKNAWTNLIRTANAGQGGGLGGFLANMGTHTVNSVTHLINEAKMAGDQTRLSMNRIQLSMTRDPKLRAAIEKEIRANEADMRNIWRRDRGISPGDPTVKNTAQGMVGLIRQFVGGGAIGGIGIKPSELPGINQRFGAAPSQIQIDGTRIDRAVKQSFNEWQEQLNRHGVAPPGPYH